MPQTDSLEKVAESIKTLLEDNKHTWGIEDVWFGDDGMIPRTPAVSVDPDDKTRDQQGTSHMTLNTFTVNIIIYHEKLGASGVTRSEAIRLGEDIEKFLHDNRYLDGSLIHSYVQSVTSGFSSRGKVVMKATRLTWIGTSKTQIV